MAACGRKTGSARSLSLPLESNPIMSRMTEELNKLKSWEETSSSVAESLGIGLSGIGYLYGCVGEFMGRPLTQQNEALVGELVSTSSRLVEICSFARVMTVQLREGIMKRTSSEDYFLTRKRVAKSAKQLLVSLRGVVMGSEKEVEGSGFAVIEVLRCVSIITVSVLEALALFLGKKPPGWNWKSRVARMIMGGGNGVMKRGAALRNELENGDLAMLENNVDGDAFAALDGGMRGILTGLDTLSSQLITTRAYLLQIIS